MSAEGIVLTPQQRYVVEAGVEYLLEKGNRVLLIDGAAGTGKTTLVCALVEAYTTLLEEERDERCTATLTAPTNKAVEVLRQKTDMNATVYSDFRTLHSALGLKYSVDEEKGTESFTPDPFNLARRIAGNTLLVVDEASMIGNELLKYVDAEMELNPDLKVIYIGDNQQLPPVNEASSPVFQRGIHRLTLTEIIRQV